MEDALAGIKLVGEASKRSRSKSKVTCKFGGACGDRELYVTAVTAVTAEQIRSCSGVETIYCLYEGSR